MNTKHRFPHLPASALTVIALALSLNTGARAGTLYWDSDGSGAVGNPPTSGVGGTGTWDTSSSKWWNGTSYQTWIAAGGQDVADLRGTAGTVTVSGTVNVNKINITVASYTISGSGTVAFTGAPGVIDVNTVNGGTFSSGATGSLQINSTGNANTSSGTGGVIALSGTPSLTSFEMAMNAGTTPMGLTTAGALGPSTATVKLTQGVLNLNGQSYNAWPTTLAGGTMRSRSASTWNGATTLTANSMLLANGSAANNLTFSSSATINLNANTLFLNSGAASGNSFIYLNGAISGTGNLALTNYAAGATASGAAGTGTVSLGAANSFSGVATVTAGLGTLALNNVNALQNATLDTGASGLQAVTFTVGGNNTYNIGALTGSDDLAIGANTISIGSKAGDSTFNAAIAGSGGGLTKVGSDKLTLSGANSYSGATTVSFGTLNTATVSTGAGSYSVANSATLGVSIATAGQTLNMSSLTLGACTLNVTLQSGNPTANVITDSGALTLNGTVTVNVLGGASLNGAEVVLLSYASGGAGTLSPGTLPTVTGFTTVLTNDTSAKKLKLIFQSSSPATITAPAAFPTSISTTYGTASSATSVSISGSSLTGDITATAPTGLEVSSDNVTYGSTATFGQTGGNVSGTLSVRLKNSAAAGNYNGPAVAVALTSPGATTVSVAMTGSGNTVAAKALTIASATAQNKWYDATTTASVTGTLQPDEAFGAGNSGDGKPYTPDVGNLTVTCTGSSFANAGPGAAISVTAGTFGLTGSAAGNYTVTQPTGLSLSANITLSTKTKNNTTTSLDLAGSWTNNAVPTSVDVCIWDSNFGTTPLTANTMGALSILGIQCKNNMGANFSILTGSGITLGSAGIDMSAANQNFSMQANPVTLGASQTWDVATTLALQNCTLNYGANTLTIQSTAGGGLVQLPTTVSGSGAWTVGAGVTLKGQYQASYPANTTTVNSGGAIDLNGYNVTVAGTYNLNGAGVSGGGAITNSSGTAATLGITGVNLQSATGIGCANPITISSPISGVGSLTKIGNSTLTLSGNNTYTGNTVISTGTLVSGAASLQKTPTTSIAAGATLDVSTAGLTLTGSNPQQTLAGSSTSGIASINAPSQTVTLNSGALLSFQAAGGISSSVGQISLTGALANSTLNSNILAVNITGLALAAGTYRLLDSTGTLTGTADPTPILTGITNGITATVSTTAGTGGHVDLVVSSTIPTPHAFRIYAANSTPAAGAADQLTLFAANADGTINTEVSSDIVLTFSGLNNAPGGAMPTLTDKTGAARNFGLPTTIAFAGGVSTAGGLLVPTKAEAATVHVSDGIHSDQSAGGNGGAALMVSAGAPSALAMQTQPSPTAYANMPFSQQPAVTVYDSFGNLRSGDNATWVFAAATNALSGTTAVQAASGLAAFSGLALASAGVDALTFTTTNGAANVKSANIIVSLLGTNSMSQVVSGNPASLAAQGVPRYSYILQRATNLAAPVWWADVTTTIADVNGLIQAADYFADLGSNQPPEAFYRYQWQANPPHYTVTYNGNGNTGGTAPTDANSPYAAGATVTVLGAGSVTKTGSTFAGWNTAANGSGTSYSPGNTFVIAENTTLYAQWTASATYTVTYSGNGNTGGAAPSDPSSPYFAGATVTVLGNTGSLTNTGYTFGGWNTAANGSGASYNPGNTFLIGANTTLYAVWTTNATSAPLVIYGDALASGWVQNGWTYSVDLANASPVHGGTHSIAVTFIGSSGFGPYYNGAAFSTANYSALSFWLNGGATGGQNLGMQICRAGAVVQTLTLAPLPANTWTNIVLPLSSIGIANVTNFNCFRFTSSAAVPVFYLDDVQLTGATVYTVSYNGNSNTGGSAPVDSSSPYASGATVTVMGAGTMGRPGYVFVGWNTAANGGGISYSPGNTFTIGASTTLYAQWSPSGATYTVTYDGNGSIGGAAPVDASSPYAVGSTVTVSDNTGGLTNPGYNFAGWNTAANGSGTSYTPGNTFIIGANTTLYAKWAPVVTALQYPYAPYNQGKMDPQLTGWPITVAESNYITLSAEYERYPGREPGGGGSSIWSMVAQTPNTQSGSDGWYIRTTEVTVRPILTNQIPLDILLVGDSITSQWGGGQMGAFGAVWLAYYGTNNTINLGIGGDRTSSILWRLDHAGFDHLVAPPKVSVLQIGNNNQYLHSQGVPTTSSVQGVVWCLRNLRSKFPTTPLIWVNLFPVTGSSSSTYLKELHDACNAAGISDPASTNYVSNVHPLDLWSQYASGDGVTANAAFFRDGVHPNDAGYTLWATNMLPLVQQALAGQFGGSVLSYPYAPYNQGLMDPQLTGWPLTVAESNYVCIPEYSRKPGHEANQNLPLMWPVTPTANHWSGNTTNSVWLDHHASLVNLVLTNRAPIDVALIGDSITEYWGGCVWDPAFANWIAPWSTNFSQYNAVNLGIGGDRTESVLWRLDHGALDGTSVKVIVLLIGVNDMALVQPLNGVSTNAIAQGIQLCVQNIRLRYPQIDLLLVKTLPTSSPGNPQYVAVQAVSSLLDQSLNLSDPKLHVLDLWNDFTNPDGTLVAAYYDSVGLHLTTAGYAAYATKLKPVLQGILGY